MYCSVFPFILIIFLFFCSYQVLKSEGLKKERVLLLESWRDMEIDALKNKYSGSGRDFVSTVEAKFPKKIKVKGSDDMDDYDLIFPDDEKKIGKFLRLVVSPFFLTF